MKKLSRILIAVLSIASVSFWSHDQGKRSIACIDGMEPIVVSSGSIPLETDLFAHIQDPELKKSTESYYKMLKQTEADYYSGFQNIRSSYGLLGGVWGDVPAISYTMFDPMTQGRILTNDTLWGNFLSTPFMNSAQTNGPVIGSPLLGQNEKPLAQNPFAPF